MGKILKGHRDEFVLATKFGMDMGTGDQARGSRRYVMKAVEASLTRLETDYLDLYQLHAPDPLTPIEETLQALTDLVHQGKVRYIGSSNFAGWQVADAAHLAREIGAERFISAQNYYNVLNRDVEHDLLPAARHFGVGVLPFFPLESGLLTGKFHRGAPASEGTRLASRPEILERTNFDLLEALREIAREADMELLDLAFGYLTFQPEVSSVIAGATSAEQVRRNVATLDHGVDAEVVTKINEAMAPWSHLRRPGHSFGV
jgi:aryl-alcohol dehydrogenase-like predicted oxidoreductase